MRHYPAMKNNLKYESYKAANKLLNQARINNDLPMCIAAITFCESIIADRLQSFLTYEAPAVFLKSGKERKFVSTVEMTKKCLKLFPGHQIELNSKNVGKIKSVALFEDLKEWISHRNDICHGFVKSKPGAPTKEINAFHKAAIQAAQEGYELTKLVSKWHKQQLQKTYKKK